MTFHADNSYTAAALIRAQLTNDRDAIDRLLPPGQPVSYALAREIVSVAAMVATGIEEIAQLGAPVRPGTALGILDGITNAVSEAEAAGLNQPDEPGEEGNRS